MFFLLLIAYSDTHLVKKYLSQLWTGLVLQTRHVRGGPGGRQREVRRLRVGQGGLLLYLMQRRLVAEAVPTVSERRVQTRMLGDESRRVRPPPNLHWCWRVCVHHIGVSRHGLRVPFLPRRHGAVETRHVRPVPGWKEERNRSALPRQGRGGAPRLRPSLKPPHVLFAPRKNRESEGQRGRVHVERGDPSESFLWQRVQVQRGRRNRARLLGEHPRRLDVGERRLQRRFRSLC